MTENANANGRTPESGHINAAMERLKAYSQQQSKAMAQKLETITKQVKTIELDQLNGTMERLKAYSQEQSKAMAEKLSAISKQLTKRADNEK